MITAPELRSAAPQSILDPRESMRSLPHVLQRPLTLITGKPLAGQRPWRLTPTHHLGAALVSLGVGLMGSWFVLGRGGAWLGLLIVTWMITLHAIRNLRMMIFHQCSHGNLYAEQRVDGLIGRAISVALLVENFRRYSREHAVDHHSARHMTLHDPTVRALLVTLGLRPGMSRRQLWRRLLTAIASPLFHLRFVLARIRSHFGPASWAERLVSTAFLAVIGALVTVTGSWTEFLVAWCIPVTVFYQVSSTFRLAVKHTFPSPAGPRRGREYFASLTYGVFLGEPAPRSCGSRFRAMAAWSRWLARMVFVHFPSRYMVLTGDTVCHDYHHRHPRSRDWPNYLFSRQRDIEAGHPGWPAYKEVWGLVPAVNTIFDSLTNCDPDEFDVRHLKASRYSLFFDAFDD